MSDFATDYVNTRTSKFHRRSALRPHYRGASQTSVIKIDGKEFLADGYHMYGRRKIYEAVQITEQACELNFGSQPGSDRIAIVGSPNGQRLP